MKVTIWIIQTQSMIKMRDFHEKLRFKFNLVLYIITTLVRILLIAIVYNSLLSLCSAHTSHFCKQNKVFNPRQAHNISHPPRHSNTWLTQRIATVKAVCVNSPLKEFYFCHALTFQDTKINKFACHFCKTFLPHEVLGVKHSCVQKNSWLWGPTEQLDVCVIISVDTEFSS